MLYFTNYYCIFCIFNITHLHQDEQKNQIKNSDNRSTGVGENFFHNQPGRKAIQSPVH